MDYIINIQAKFNNDLTNLHNQYKTIKSDIEKYCQENPIKLAVQLSEVSIKNLQEQLNSQKLSVNVGDVKFDNTGLDTVRSEMQQVANTTNSVTQQTQQAKQAVQQLADAYKHLAKEQVQAMIGNKLPSSKNIDSNGITVIDNKPAEASAQSLISAMNQVQKAYENAFGKGNVDVQGITAASGKIDAFTISAKNAENEILKFRYSLQSIKDEANEIKGFSFNFMGGAFNESAIKDTQEYNKELKNQEKELQRINDLYNNIIASTHEKNKPMLGVDTQNGVISKNGLYGEQSSTLKTQIDTYIDEYSKLKQKIEEIQQTIKSGHTVNQQEIKDLQDREAAFKRLAEVIRSAQYADTQMSSKSVVNQKAILNEEIKEFENDVRNSNLVSQDFIDRIHAVNQALQTVGDRNSFRTVYEDLRKLEAEFDSLQKVSQSNAARNSFNVDYSKATASLDGIVKKVRELGIDEDKLTFTTTDLIDAFANITDKYSLQTLNKMLSQATKEVRQQTQEIQTQEKEWQKLTDLINKAYGEATNSNTNGKAIQDPATIKLLRDQYDAVVVAVNEVRNATTDTFDQSKKSAEQAIQAFIEYSKVLQNSEQSIQATDNAIKKLQTDTSKGLFAQNSGNSEVVQLQQDITNLSNQYAQLQARFQNEGSTGAIIAKFIQLDNQIKSTSERAKELSESLKSTKDAAALEDRKSNLNNKIETWLRNNTRASESMRQSMKSLQTQIQSADKQTLTHLTQQFNELNRTAQQTGQIGKSALDIFKEKAAKFAGWFGLANVFMMITNEGKQALVTLKDVDSILTEISKTSERSAESLEKLGETAFDAASKYGVSVQNYLTGVQEMARAGYETMGEGQSEKMAELALLAQAAGGVSDSVARDYLIATDAAYQLGGSIEKLTSILDSQNMVTNNYAVSMQDMASATKDAAAMANQYGVSIEELSALIAIATSRTRQSGDVIGNSLKSIFVSLSDQTNANIVKAFDSVGVSMYKIIDGAKLLKTPIELLGELAEVFNKLPIGDDRRSTILNDIFGRYRANVGAAILQDWDSMQGIMETYERGTGSAMREAVKSVNNLSGSLQNLKTSGQEFFSKFFDTDKVTGFLKAFTQLVQLATDLVDTLGAIPTILGTIGATALLKNGGITGTITALSQFLSGSLLGKFGQSMKSVFHLIKEVPNFSAATSEGIRSLAAAVEGLNYADQAMILAQNKVTKSTIALTLATNGAESADINAAMATIGNVTAKEKLTEAELADILTLQYGNRERAVAVASQIAKTVADQNGTLAIENLTTAQFKNIATTNGLTAAEAAGTAQMLGMKSATIGLSGAMGTLGTVISNVLLALKTIAPELILISAAIAGIIAIWKYISKSDEQRKKLSEESENRKQKYQEEIETAKKMSTEYSNSAKSLESYADKYTKLSKKISLSSEDKEELISVQKELIDTYGSEANGIDLINGKYEENIKLLTQLTQKERERARQNAQAAYYDSKGQTFARNENGGSKVIDKYQGASKKDSDKVYRKIMNYAEALKLLEESTFGDGSYWGSETVLTFNPSMSTDELIGALDAQINAMDQYFDREEKATITWQEQYAKLTALRTEAIEKQKEEVNILNNYANSIVESYTNNEIDFSNVTEETYQAWHDGLIAQFASDDPDLRNAIEDKLQSMFDWLGGGNKTTVAFDWATFADEQGLEDIEKLLGKLQTAYKNLEETGNGFALDSDILSAFPDLAKYLNDAEILKFKLQQLANAQMQPLIDQLRDIQSTLNPLSSDYSEVENLIKWLQQQADVTAKVKEKTTKVSDLYKDQKLQIHENIQALEREVKTIDKQIDALEKKKDLQEKYIKTLEKEKDRLEDLIDDYETAASAIKDYIDEQNDGLEKQKDKIEERYDAQIKAIEETYDKQVKLIEAQEEGFDKQIKALQDEADEQDRLNKLKEKELALEKAKNEKVRVYTAERGWVKGLPRFIIKY